MIPDLNNQKMLLRGNQSSGGTGEMQEVTSPSNENYFNVVWIMKIK